MKLKQTIIKQVLFPSLILILILTATIGCSDGVSGWDSDSGEGGSLNRFTIVNDYMYVVDNQYLKVFDIEEPTSPVKKEKISIGSDIETIFAANGMLFIGSRSGMYIYNLDNPEKPEYLSTTVHIYNCDPVVADTRYAYVTISSNNFCRGWTNELQIVDILDPAQTEVVKTYSLDQPKGLGIKGNLLFVCDKQQIRVYDKSQAPNLESLYDIPVSAKDVIVLDTILLVITDRALYQYSYTSSDYDFLSMVYEVNE